MVTFDEKPVFCERFHRFIWRKKNSGPAAVKGHGRTRHRETVVLPSCSNGKKLPLIWIFHGKYQKKVKVPAKYPTLVVFTLSAVMNGQLMVHTLDRAILPNLEPGHSVVFLDLFAAHFGDPVQEDVARPEVSCKLKDAATPPVRKKQKTEEGIAGSDEESETSDDEEHHAFDEKHSLAEAEDRLGADFALELSPPEVFDCSLVGLCIAFHHGEPQPGWDCGEVKRQVDPSTHKEGYNYDIFYPDRGGTVFHRLQLELYGVGNEDGSPLGSGVLLAGAAKKKSSRRRKKI